jgi:prepilin-type N-terminal cleavage/methylation domain-containing protein
MAGHPYNKTHSSRARGFTIVELLIVIVVIAILAAIVIVAYTGIQNKAHAAAAQSAASDVTKLLGIYNTTNGTYPADLTTVNNGQPMPTSGGTSYAYHPGAGNTSYCATVTNGNSSYKVTDTATTPVTGGCPGDGVGGVAAITNYVLNPSAEVSATGIATDSGSPTIVRSTAFANQGAASFMLTDTVVSTDIAGRLNVSLNPGTYTFTYYVYAPDARQGGFDWYDNTAAVGLNGVGTVAIPANTWTRVSGAVTFGGSGLQNVAFYMHNRNGPNVSGASLYIDGLMVTDGTTTYNYADGSTPNWIWNGAANNSTSTGPPQ